MTLCSIILSSLLKLHSRVGITRYSVITHQTIIISWHHFFSSPPFPPIQVIFWEVTTLIDELLIKIFICPHYSRGVKSWGYVLEKHSPSHWVSYTGCVEVAIGYHMRNTSPLLACFSLAHSSLVGYCWRLLWMSQGLNGWLGFDEKRTGCKAGECLTA